jgi:hypothetical protein
VDIDLQAVEVTKLSLLLKVLEGENEETINQQLKMFHERALPDLGSNINCGNSLIGPDFFEGQLIVDQEERNRINAFDWKSEFKEIMDAGGFDAVIGNPPYVRQEELSEYKYYFAVHYRSSHGVADLYVYFIEKGISLLRSDGIYGVIVSSKWMRVKYGQPLRTWLRSKSIEEIVDFGDLAVFENATTYTCILRVGQKGNRESISVAKMRSLDFRELQEEVNREAFAIRADSLSSEGWALADGANSNALARIRDMGIPLVSFVGDVIYYGIKTGLNDAFVIDADTRQRIISEDRKSKEIIVPFLVGRDIRRYRALETDRHLLFTRRGVDISRYPGVEKHLSAFRDRLMPRPTNWRGKVWSGRKPGPYQWFEIQDTVDYYEEFQKPKIIWPGISAELTAFAFDDRGIYGNDNTQVIVSEDKYLLGVLNSAVSRFILRNICDKVQGGFYRLKIAYIKQLPIRKIDFSNPHEVALHKRIVQLVDSLLMQSNDLVGAKTDQEKTALQRQIDAIDKQIDALVYELYGLTEEEIGIVEGASTPGTKQR